MKKTLVLLLLLAGLSVEAQGDVLTWTGEGSSEWKTWDVTNWVDESGTPTVYQNGYDVVFADCSFTLVQSFGVSPASVLVENSKGCDYNFETITYTDGLQGAMSLTKKGDGNLKLNAYNSYTGNTYIYGGKVTVTYIESGSWGKDYSHSLGSGTVYLYGGELDIMNGEVLVNNVIVDGNAHMCGDVGGTLTLNEKARLL